MSNLNSIHFATGWEALADAIPDAPAVICGATVRSWREYDNRAARLAGLLSSRGLEPQAKIGLYLHNCNEYLEAHYAALKQRAIPINVNYRYTVAELTYLLENADAQVLIYHARYRNNARALVSQLNTLHTLIEVDDGTQNDQSEFAIGYEQALSSAAPAARIERDPSDIYMFYTGGTTGMPKGVMYQCGTLQNAFYKAFDRLDLPRPEDTQALAEVAVRLQDKGVAPVSFPACPLMHATGLWIGALGTHNVGGAVVTSSAPGLDAAHILTVAEQRRVSNLVIVGDAFARPLLAELERAQAAGTPYDLSNLQTIGSSGTMWSQEVKAGLLRHADATLRDTIGSTEGGMGTSETTREETVATAKFELGDGVEVFDDNDQPVVPGSGDAGRVAISGMVPLGYYKDPEKSAATFRTISGTRYSFPGDWATVETDGSIKLLGRGSACINTAGEKVYPEEVEEVLKRFPGITDCLVVGLADEQYGQRIVAVCSASDGCDVDERALLAAAREQLAGYKLPKRVFFAPAIQRSASGKPDYPWAREIAAAHVS